MADNSPPELERSSPASPGPQKCKRKGEPYSETILNACCNGRVWRKNTVRLSIGAVFTLTANMSWQKLEMILTTDGRLYLYKNESSQNPLKILDLSNFVSVQLAAYHISKEDTKSFRLDARQTERASSSTRDEIFCVPQDTHSQWLSHLEDAIKKNQSRSPHDNKSCPLPPQPLLCADEDDDDYTEPTDVTCPDEPEEEYLEPSPVGLIPAMPPPPLPMPTPQLELSPKQDVSAEERNSNIKASTDDNASYLDMKGSSQLNDGLIYEDPTSSRQVNEASLTEASSWQGDALSAMNFMKTKNPSDGAYLVRRSHKAPGNKTLLVVCDDSPCKFQLEEDPISHSVVMMNEPFQSLEALLQHYTRTNLPKKTTPLTTPYKRL